MYIQVDGLQKEVSGDRKLRLHTARITSGIMNAVGSMHRHGHSHTAGRMLSIIGILCQHVITISLLCLTSSLSHACHILLLIITSSARAVVKYCDECVCLSVRQDISGTTRAVRQFFVHVAYVRGSVLLRLSPGRGFLPH